MKFVWDRRFLAACGVLLVLLLAFFLSPNPRAERYNPEAYAAGAERETLPDREDGMPSGKAEASPSNLLQGIFGTGNTLFGSGTAASGKENTASGANISPGGWEQDAEGTWYFRKEDGSLAAGEFLTVEERYYYFAEDGKMLTGLIRDGDDWYLASDSGALYFDGWIRWRDHWYYAGEDGVLYRSRRSPDGYALNDEGQLSFSGSASGYRYVNRNGRKLILNLENADKIHDYLKKYGWTETAIAGVLGNFQQESGLDPSLEQYSNGVGYGLGQWSYGRRTALEEYAKARMLPVSNLYLQLDYMMVEPDEKAYVDRYSRTNFSSPAEAAMDWGVNWERYNLSDGSMLSTRIPYAAAYYDWYTGR